MKSNINFQRNWTYIACISCWLSSVLALQAIMGRLLAS